MIRRLHFVASFSAFFIAFLYVLCAGDDYATWSSSRRMACNTTFTGANVAGDVLDVPVLLRLHPGNFAYFSQTLDGGADIRFAKSDGTHLPYQIARWVDNAANNDTAEIWIKIDTVLGNRISAPFRMFWGKADAVDSSNGAAVFDTANGFVGVWHLDEDPTGGASSIKDATGNTLHATPTGDMSVTDRVAGVVGSAHRFDGINDGDSIPYASPLNIANGFTLSGWVNVSVFQTYARIITRGMPQNATPWSSYSLNTQKAEHQFRGEVSSGDDGDQNYVLGKKNLLPGTWYHVVTTYDRSTLKMYRNGQQDSLNVAANKIMNTSLTTPLMIGKSNYGTNFFNGSIDEARVEKIARDSNWIKLCFENQKTGQSLVPEVSVLNWDISMALGMQAGSGIWGTNSLWSTNGTQLVPWLGRGTAAVFTGGAGSYTVQVNGRQQLDSLNVRTTTYSFTGGTLDFGIKSGIFIGNATTTSIASDVTGNGGLSKSGPGTLLLSGACTYSGPTAVRAGELLVNDSLPAGSAVTAAPGTTIGGSGILAGDVSAKGAVISPGIAGPGTLRMGSLVLDTASGIDLELGTVSDSIVIAGNLTLDGTVNISAAAGFGPGTYRFITYAGIIRNDTLKKGTLPAGRKCTFEYGTGYVAAIISPGILQSVLTDTFIVAGTAVTFSASAEGSGTIDYRWERFPGDSIGTGPTYSIPAVKLTDNGSRFRCIARDAFISDTSRWALLTVIDTPRVTTPPHDTTVAYGREAFFHLTLADTTLCTYQWLKTGTSEVIATTQTLTIDSVGTEHEGDYFCRISNPVATVKTDNVHLTATIPPPVVWFNFTPKVGTVPLTVSFTDSSTGAITSREWSFGDGSTDTSLNPVHVYTASGLYNVTLSLTGPGGTTILQSHESVYAFDQGENPLQIHARYIGENNAAVVITNINLIDTTKEQLQFDSIGIWITPDSLPQDRASAQLLKTFPRSWLNGSSLIEILTLPSTDSVFGLMTGLFWSNGSISEFKPANGTIVLLYDTLSSNLALQNALHLTSLSFDSGDASLRVAWCLDTALFQNNLEVGIAYSLDAPPHKMTGTQVVKMLNSCSETTLSLSAPLYFDTLYQVAIFVRRTGTAWPAPTDAARKSIRTGAPFRQPVTYFDTSGNDTVTAFNDRILLWKDGTISGYPVTTDTIEVFPYTPPAGFVIVGTPFHFMHPGSAVPFFIGIRVRDLPAGADLNDVHFYHIDGSIITVDYSSTVDAEAGIVYLRVHTANLKLPFIAMVDQQPPQVSFIHPPDSIAYADKNLVDSVKVSDNISNVRWTYLFSSGDKQPVPRDSGILNDTSAMLRLVLSSSLYEISSEFGVRILLAVSDGTTCDTINLSRPVFRNKSDEMMTAGNTWQPVYATAQLDNADPDSVIIARLSDRKTYNKRVMRLYRWVETPANMTNDTNKWVEYDPHVTAVRSLFSVVPGRLLWLKTRNNTPLHFGTARTLSLRDTFSIELQPRQFTDLGMPFRFGVQIRDILAATNHKTDSVQFYIWSRDSSTNRYYLDQLYIGTMTGKNDPMTILKFSRSGGYSLYNPGTAPVTLRIPPTLATDPGLGKKKGQTKEDPSWGTKFIATGFGGTDLPALYCGYTPGLQKSVFPVTPTFLPIRVFIFNRTTGEKEGHYISSTAAEGVIKEIRLTNTSDSTKHLTYRIENVGAFPASFSANLFDASRQQFSTAGSVEVAPGSAVSRWLVIGDAEMFNRFVTSVSAFDYGFQRIYPNPARSVVNFRFSLRFGSQEKVLLTIYDLRGRKVWEKRITSLLAAGEHLITWDGRDIHRSTVSAGRYPVRLSIIGTAGKVVQRFDRVLTYIP